MAIAKNKVVAGDYLGCYVGCADGAPYIKTQPEHVHISITDISSYQLVSEEQGRSLSSGLVRGAIGGVLFGTIGLIGGALLAKESCVYTVSVDFKDGKRSLIEIDERRYRALVRNCF